MLAFDREQGYIPDGASVDLAAAMGELAFWEQMALEDDVDGLQVEFGRHVADRQIFVVETLGRIRTLAVTSDKMFKHLPMAGHVAAEIHRHEARQLQESRIN